MVFNLDGQALVTRIERWTFGDGPGFEHAVDLKPQVVMQPTGSVLLHDKAGIVAPADRALAAWLRRFFEIALGAVARQGLLRHWDLPELRPGCFPPRLSNGQVGIAVPRQRRDACGWPAPVCRLAPAGRGFARFRGG
jgi:hypothetical protein